MLKESLGQDPAEYGDRFGRVRLWHIGGRVGVLESSGALEAGHASFAVDYFGRHVDGTRGGPRFAFGNWLEVTTYRPDVRSILTDWQGEQRYDGLYVALTSPLMATSVALANMLLSREIHVHATLKALHETFERVLRVAGLSHL